MKKLIAILLVLAMAGICGATTKYVAVTGHDGTSDGNESSPYKTIHYAVSQISSNDIIKVGAGTYYESYYLDLNRAITATIESQSGLNDVYIKPSSLIRILQFSTAAGTYTLNHLNFMPIGESCAALMTGAVDNYSAIFNYCVFDMNGIAGKFMNTGTTTEENLAFNNCTFTHAINSSCHLYSFNTVEFNDCNFTRIYGLENNLFCWVEGDSNTLKIKNNYSEIPSNWMVFTATAPNTDTLTNLIMTGNTTTNCYNFIRIDDVNITFGEVCNNNITQTDGGVGLYIGKSDAGEFKNTLKGWVIKNNTVTKNNGVWGIGHLLIMGYNCYGAEVANNVLTETSIYAGAYGVFNLGKYNNFHHNFVKARDALYLSGPYAKIQNNTIYGIGGSCLYWESGATGCDITNNIFDASGGGNYAISNSDCGHRNNCFDYNCYKTGRYGVARLDNATYDTIPALTAKWAAWSFQWPDNDANSIIADPQFMDIANGDFKLNLASPCLNTGKPTVGGGYTTMGAWQPNTYVPRTIPAGDIDGDSKVDFYDFTILADNWLIDCFDDPANPACISE